MKRTHATLLAIMGVLLVTLVIYSTLASSRQSELAAGREEVVFWHFWGGADRQVVESVVKRFNSSQEEFFVRAVAMPGNNLDVKLFLSVTGEDPPDLINQDDPILADWAYRDILTPLDELASPQELDQLTDWLLPAAQRLGRYQDRLYGLCNGLDIRALYYNASLIEEILGVETLPRELPSIESLDEIAQRCTLLDKQGRAVRLGYLPDARRLWAWGVVFGGRFYDPAQQRVTADAAGIVNALDWMSTYRQRYGANTVRSFRQGDQSLPGKIFPLLAGRYAIMMDGQWRTRDISRAQALERESGQPVTRYGVWALPKPASATTSAEGWVNGNFFLVPRGARNPRGSWAFMKFWSGFNGHEAEAAITCRAGGWIPPSERVIEQPSFQDFLATEPLFARFVELAAGDQVPTPLVPGAAMFQRTINRAAEKSMTLPSPPPPAELLKAATWEIQQHLDRVMSRPPRTPGSQQP